MARRKKAESNSLGAAVERVVSENKRLNRVINESAIRGGLKVIFQNDQEMVARGLALWKRKGGTPNKKRRRRRAA